MQEILNRGDRGIYFVVGDTVKRHPLSDELDDMVTRMAFAAMHRDGEPFTFVRLDDSAPVAAPLPLDGLAPEPRRRLPPPDGKLWLATDQHLSPLG